MICLDLHRYIDGADGIKFIDTFRTFFYLKNNTHDLLKTYYSVKKEKP